MGQEESWKVSKYYRYVCMIVMCLSFMLFFGILIRLNSRLNSSKKQVPFHKSYIKFSRYIYMSYSSLFLLLMSAFISLPLLVYIYRHCFSFFNTIDSSPSVENILIIKQQQSLTTLLRGWFHFQYTGRRNVTANPTTAFVFVLCCVANILTKSLIVRSLPISVRYGKASK